MTLFARRPLLRWLLPVVVAAALATGGTAVATLSADAKDSLPGRTAAQLLVDVQKARLDGLSGTVVQTASLGLPALPDVGGAPSADFQSLVSGSHTMRVWYAGPDRARVALLGQLGESDLVRNGTDVWLWSSSTNSAHHLTVPAASDTPHPSGDPAVTPQQAADLALAAITPSTTVTTDPTAEVAGRPAYQLVLTPKDATTLVGSVRIAVDGATHVPTRVQVFAKDASTPAFEVGFTSFDPTTPDASVFDFNPPPGASVTEGLGDLMPSFDPSTSPDVKKPTIAGSGWSSVVVAQLPQGANPLEAGDKGSPLATVIKALPVVSGSWGSGRLFSGPLFSVLLTDDGRVVAGAVPPSALYAAL